MGRRWKGLKKYQFNYCLMEYDVLIKQTQEILENNRNDWEDRFISYLSDTAKNRQRILDRRKQFHKWANLSVYFTLGRAKDNSGQFVLRYEGQSVGSVSVSKKGVKWLTYKVPCLSYPKIL